jgi:chromosomal replication initiator protein
VLTGVVCSLYSEALFAQQAVTAELVDLIIQRHVGRPVEPTLEEIKRAACEVFGITRTVLESASRQRSHCEARHIVMHLARRMTEKSLPQIAKALGGMHHTSVMHGADRIQAILDGKPLDTKMSPEQASAVRARLDQVMIALRALLAVRARASR